MIFYKAKSDLDLIRFTDIDWVGDNIDQKSTQDMCSCLQKDQSVGQAISREP